MIRSVMFIHRIIMLFLFIVMWPVLAVAEDSDAALQIGKSKLVFMLDASEKAVLPESEFAGWIARSAQTLENFYGYFPVPEAYIALQIQKGKGVHRGMAMGIGSASINIWLGGQTDTDDLRKDWIMVHEMVHLAFPKVASQHEWIEEGIATYVEPIARAGVGTIPAEQVWRFFVEGMPNGLPVAGDKGLDNTPTWGRIYWGGALFCLLADIQIRQQTQGKKSLRDALVRILDEGYTFLDSNVDLMTVLKVADKATETNVLVDLYKQHRNTPVFVDLNHLWQQLGVSSSSGRIQFDDTAPLAAIRQAITEVN